jgi:hypothetical protein
LTHIASPIASLTNRTALAGAGRIAISQCVDEVRTIQRRGCFFAKLSQFLQIREISVRICLPTPGKQQRGERFATMFGAMIGTRSWSVVHVTYRSARLGVSSLGVSWAPPRCARAGGGAAHPAAVRNGPVDLASELNRLYPGGVLVIDPATLVASQPAERYEVLPNYAGLMQLVENGALTRNRGGEFLIQGTMRFPAEVEGKFLLLRGVPLPRGNPGRATVISEETGQPIDVRRAAR